MEKLGLVGLGNMGSALAANLVACGHELVVHDLAGPERCPTGAIFVDDVARVASAAAVVVLSLPDGAASEAVAREIAEAHGRTAAAVVDTSTIGPSCARAIAEALAAHGIGYVDAPVSGGVAGARARTLAVMVAGEPEARERSAAVLEGLSDRRYHVGDRAGMAQALKLANNFLSATALAATSEAVAFCTAAGLDMATVLEVLNASSGRSAASEDKFVNHVLTGTYASGFLNTLMAKDLRLYLGAVEQQGTANAMAATTTEIWQRFVEADPGVDFTAVHRFTEGQSALRVRMPE
jgi:3-hydroxyisobutyrate dehydrogenase-like beta-hydroxyacid dehydrogenase